MAELTFLRDLAVVMAVSALTTVLFHLLRQPVVLGYLVAGGSSARTHPRSRLWLISTASIPWPSWASSCSCFLLAWNST